MPKTIIHRAEVTRLEVLDPDGNVDAALMPPLAEEQLVKLYADMVRMRRFDTKAVTMQRQGRMGTWGSLEGQEAAQAGMALAMGREDWLVPSFREHGLMLLHGVPGHLIYAAWRGDERGCSFPPGLNCLPMAVPVGSQFLHAAGLGHALRLQEKRAAAVGCGGDGATSEGDFHEAMNFAAVFKTNTVFFIQNNGWAISVPLRRQTVAATLAQRADAYGMPGIQVDGNDVLAVYAASHEALERARTGGGPTLIEAVTFRMGNHTTADEASRYRPPEEVAAWRPRDPILRLGKLLRSRGLWDDVREEKLQERATGEVEQLVATLEAMPPPAPEEMVDHVYAQRPWFLEEQRRELVKEVAP
jgi:pyruvate dehydrogenase E1 component alpha subunit